MNGQSAVENGSWKAMFLAIILLISMSVALVPDSGHSAPPDYASRINYASYVPYHSAADGDEFTGEACLQMAFDFHGPSITQQDIRNVTTGRLESGTADPEDLIRAGHFSSASRSKANPQQQGYEERTRGYGAFQQDWTDYRRDPSPRFEQRFQDIYRAVSQGHFIIAYMYLDMPPEINPDPNPSVPNIDPQNPSFEPNPQPPDPQVTPQDLAALEKVWRIIVGYDTNMGEGEIILHDPLPEGEGYAGGKEVRMKLSDFDRLWNVTTLDDGTFRTHRIGVSVSPWNIDMTLPENERIEAGREFDITANVSYSAPANMEGISVQDPSATLEIPEDYELVEGGPSKTLSLGGPMSYSRVTWRLRAPERSYSGQDYSFSVNASGQIVSTSPAYRDNIGGRVKFEVETYGYLNHPPVIISASVTPDRIPDDGSVSPVVTCEVEDEDGNLREVLIDLTDVGGRDDVRMFDNGQSGGDQTAGDGIYTYTIRDDISKGTKTLSITATDSKRGEDTANLTLEVDDLSAFRDPPEIVDLGLYPPKVPNDGFTTSTIWAQVTDPDQDVYSVYADLTPVGGDPEHPMYDDGSSGDIMANDGNFSSTITVPATITLGTYDVNITAEDSVGLTTSDTVEIDVILPPVAPEVEDAQADPDRVPNDGETKVVITAIVVDGNDDIDEVYADLRTIGGPSKEVMKNDGIFPDNSADDDIWTLETTVGTTVTTGSKRVEITAVDRSGFDDSRKVTVTVTQANNRPRIEDYTVESRSVAPGDTVKVFVNASDQDRDISTVILDLSELNMGQVVLNDDGQAPDEESGDMVYSGSFQVSQNISDGTYNVTITVTDLPGDTDRSTFTLVVDSGSSGGDTTSIPQELFIGIPVALGVFLLIILLFLFLGSRSRSTTRKPPAGRPPQFKPMPPNQGQAPYNQPGSYQARRSVR